MHPDLAEYGPVRFHSDPNALYERHLLFDYAIDPDLATPRERYEAVARSLRDVLAIRWLKTKKAQYHANPKHAYYLSMEFLIGRSLASNVSNLLLDPAMLEACREKNVDWYELLDQEPDAGLGNGGLGRLAACFIESMATLELPAMGYGLRYEYGIFKQSISDGWQNEKPDNWLRRPDPWEVVRLDHIVEVHLNASFQIRDGKLMIVPGKASTLLGIPFDRPVVGYGGDTINTLRLWSASAPDSFHFHQFGNGDFVGAVTETLAAESITRVLYPDDSTEMGRELRFLQEYFLCACSIHDIVRRFRSNNTDWNAFADKVAIQMNDTHPTISVAAFHSAHGVPRASSILENDPGVAPTKPTKPGFDGFVGSPSTESAKRRAVGSHSIHLLRGAWPIIPTRPDSLRTDQKDGPLGILIR